MRNDLNLVMMTGRLTQDPRMIQTPKGAILTTFNIAVNFYRGKESSASVSYVDCAAYGTTAQFIGNYFRKGSEIVIERGHIDSRIVYNKDTPTGKFKSTKVIIDSAAFGVKTKSDNADNEEIPPSSEPEHELPAYVPADDLPF